MSSSIGGLRPHLAPLIPTPPAAADPPRVSTQPPLDQQLASHFAALSPSAAEQSRLHAFLGAARTAAVAPSTDPRATLDAARRQTMDDFRRRFEGPYRVGDESVSAAPMFRINIRDAGNAALARANRGRLDAVCRQAGISATAVSMCCIGRASANQLRLVTQALLDAGELRDDLPGDTTAEKIRQMQWKFGIGLDCVGYSRQVAAAVHGRQGARAFKYGAADGMPHTMANGGFARSSDPTTARVGDLLCLASFEKGEPGHNVCVYSHRILEPGQPVESTDPALVAFAARSGPVHAYEVDSSWGAGNGNSYGGVRRDTWFYDAGTKTWAWTNPATQRLETSARGPQDERFLGVFRPRGAP